QLWSLPSSSSVLPAFSQPQRKKRPGSQHSCSLLGSQFSVPDQSQWRSQGGSLKYHIRLKWSAERNEWIRACLLLASFFLPYIVHPPRLGNDATHNGLSLFLSINYQDNFSRTCCCMTKLFLGRCNTHVYSCQIGNPQ
ncbi:hypothetical protein LEMLEM_LOCUS14173, partial [Lemmus lemmus]